MQDLEFPYTIGNLKEKFVILTQTWILSWFASMPSENTFPISTSSKGRRK